jgi:hypothetical protein
MGTAAASPEVVALAISLGGGAWCLWWRHSAAMVGLLRTPRRPSSTHSATVDATECL